MKRILLMSAIFFLSGCAYLDPNPPKGKTEGYVHEPSPNSNQVIDESTNIETEATSIKENEIRTGMAIFRPLPEQMIYITLTEEVEEDILNYSEEDIAYWNALALEYGLQPFDGISDFDFEQFVANVQLAIDNTVEVEEPVYEEPVYEYPSYEEESSYEEPSYEVPSSEYEEPLPDESSVEAPESN